MLATIIGVPVTDIRPGSMPAEFGPDLWQSIAHAIPDMLLLVDRGGKILFANRARAGKAASGLLGRNALDYVPPGSRSELEESLRQVFNGGDARSREQRVIYSDGTEAWYTMHTGPVVIDDEVVAAVIVARDITQHRKLEQQIRQWQRMDALGQFAGGIAHDFNNVLTTILASADLLTTDLKEEEPKADARAIVTAARQGAALVSQLLTFARRQTTVVSEALDMNDVAREMATITRRLLGPDITLILELKSAEALARIDRSNAEQVVMNLLMNARDAITGSGSIYLTVAANRGGSRYTLLRVRDTGSGMTPEVQQRMFEPFFTTKGGKGTGLGLSTVYGIVTQAGGTLDVQSAVGFGTTIDVLLPGE